MNLINSILRGRLAPFVAALIGLAQIAVIGFRGVDRRGLQWLERSRQLGTSYREEPTQWLSHAPTDLALIDVYGASFFVLSPSLAPWLLFAATATSAALCAGLTFALGRRLSDPLTGWLALGLLLCTAPWFATYTSIDPTAMMVPLWLGILLLWHHQTLTWWARALFVGPLLTTAILLWPPSTFLILVLLITSLVAHRRSLPTFALHRLLPTALAAGGLFAYPFLWPDTLANLQTLLLMPLQLPPDQILFRGTAYPPETLPPYFGYLFLQEQLPLAIAVATTLAVLWGLRALLSRRATHLESDLLWLSILLLFLPPVLNTPFPHDASLPLITMVLLLPLASDAGRRFFLWTLSRSAPTKKTRQIALATYLLLMTSILLEVPRAAESPEAFRSPMTARLTGWSAAQDMASRSPILPTDMITDLQPHPDASLYESPWEDFLDLYADMNLLDDLSRTDDPADADFAIRPIPTIHPSIDYSTTHPPLPDSKTTAIPAIHRPLFLIDIQHH